MAAKRIRFGIFMPPFNSPSTQGATSSLMRNVETIKLLDELGYDEAWVGEHHSAGAEIIADPLLFLVHVAPRFQPSHARLQASEAAARAVHDDLYEKNGAAIQAWTDQNQRTVPRAATS